MIRKIAIATGVALLFVGCTQPGFDPNNKVIGFVEGKAFRAPYGVNYSSRTLDSKGAEFQRYAGVSYCRSGDITWGEKKTMDNLRAIGNTSGLVPAMRKAASEGKIGCSSPLSQQEYNYYVNQENQQRQQAASDQAYYNNINNSANQQIQQRNEQFYRDNYILNRMGY